MFQFLQPIWLFALAGLAVPVIIHLWNQRPGKVLKVGSIALVTASTRRYKKKIQVSEVLLLLLRCVLLACIAFALAGPVWKSPENKNNKGWVMLSRQDIPEGYNRFKPVIDSLLSAGFEFHFFEPGFTKYKLADAIKEMTDSNTKPVSYRELLASLNEQTDTSKPLYIFSSNYLRNFGGERKAVSLNLHWKLYTGDTSSIEQVTDTTQLHVSIYTSNYKNDARYVQAALDALQQFAKKNISTQLLNNAKDIPAQQDWLFWLDDEPPADTINAKNLVRYAIGKPEKVSSAVLPAEGFIFDPVKLYKLISASDSTQNAVDVYWKDGFGHPLLTAEQLQNKKMLTLYTHFDPAWTELPWSDNFPSLLYSLLYSANSNVLLAGGKDKTIIDIAQAYPLIQSVKEAENKPALFTETKLAGICWMLAFALFFAERLLSFHYYKTKEAV